MELNEVFGILVGILACGFAAAMIISDVVAYVTYVCDKKRNSSDKSDKNEVGE